MLVCSAQQPFQLPFQHVHFPYMTILVLRDLVEKQFITFLLSIHSLDIPGWGWSGQICGPPLNTYSKDLAMNSS